MAFTLSPHQRGFAASVRAAAEQAFRPAAQDSGPEAHTGRVDRALLRRLADSGLLARLFPDKGASALELCLLRENTAGVSTAARSEEHTSELQSRENLVCRLLLEKK